MVELPEGDPPFHAYRGCSGFNNRSASPHEQPDGEDSPFQEYQWEVELEVEWDQRFNAINRV